LPLSLQFFKKKYSMTASTITTAAQNGHHPQAEETVVAAPIHDEFDAAEYEEGRESLPYLQMLNHPDATQAGFFITAENMEAAFFVPNEDWSLHTTTFQSGESAEGYRSLVARLLILRKSKLLMYHRDRGEYVSDYQKSTYDRAIHVLKQRYLVYLISKDKQLMHDTPLMLTTKGAFCGSFGETVRNFHSEMSKAYGAATGAKRPRGDKFMALSVLAVRVQPELKGKEKKSWVCSVTSYGKPTAENWKSYFVGYDAEIKERILQDFDAWADFGKALIQPPTPSVPEEPEFGYDEF
jgi:hypothetical protein